MQALFEAVREACPRGLWAKGVKLARDGSVARDAGDPSEIALRVSAPELPFAATVVLYPDDEEWDCDCGSRAAACAHVAAAVIALQTADQRGSELATTQRAGAAIRYQLTRAGGDLRLQRLVGDRAVDGSVQAIAGVQPSQADLAADVALRTLGRRPPRPHEWAAVLTALDGVRDVTLDGHVVYATGDPVLPVAIVTDAPNGAVELRVVPNPSITEVVADGVALCGDTLQPLGHPEITGARLERLPFGKLVPPAEFAALVTETIPQLEADIPVDIQTTRLPEVTTAAEPRIAIEVEQGDALSVLPTLVYGTPPIARIDGDRMVHLRGPAPVRKRARERALLHQLRDRLNLVPGRRVEYVGGDAVRITQQLHAWQGDGRDRTAPGYVLPSPLVPRVDFADGFSLEFSSDDPDPGQRRRASAEAVMGAWQSGLELVPLEGGGWAPLPADWLARHGHRVADLLAARDAAGELPRYALPDVAALCEELGEPLPASTEPVRALLAGFAELPEVAPPDDFTGELRDYQRAGVSWLCALRDAGVGALLADDMGLGKTVQTLCALSGRALVVCPTSVLPTWADEIRRFRPKLRASLYHGPDRELDPKADVTLTSYALLRIDSVHLSAVAWDTVVLDEAQAIKNPQSQVARAAYRLKAGFRVALTGTPVENRLTELWSQIRFTNPGLLGDKREFQRRYARPIARDEPGVAARLRQRIRPFLLRRLKAQVEPELPPRTDAILHCELDEEERAVYDAIRVATRDEIAAKLRDGGGVMAALEALLRLRQAACHRALVPGQEASTSSKLAELLDALDRVVPAGHKALVFSQWTSLLDLVEPHLRAAGIAFTRLDGSTRDRGAVVTRFQSTDGPPVMLVSLKAGGTGLTLTEADHVFLLDPWWNPAVEDQAADRTHRIGQTRPVMVYRLVAEDTVESRILALQERKRAVADAALADASRGASITREDLLALLE